MYLVKSRGEQNYEAHNVLLNTYFKHNSSSAPSYIHISSILKKSNVTMQVSKCEVKTTLSFDIWVF